MSRLRSISQFVALLGSVSAVMLVGCLPSGKVTANRANAEAMEKYFQGGGGAGEIAAVELPDPDGFGILKGTFKVVGTPAAQPALSVTADIGYCAPSGSMPSEQVVVGPDGGLRDVLIFLEMDIPQDEKWEHPDYQATKDATLTGREQGFDQQKCRFLSHVFAMRSSQKLEIINSDTVGHNTKVDGPAAINVNLPSKATDIYDPKGEQKNAPFPVSCSVHPWMKAWVITRDNPYFAVTDAEGNFEIKNVPSGVELKFRVWQDKLGFVNVPVKVDGEDVTWKKGRLPLITIDNGASTTLNVDIDASAFN